MEQLQTQKYLRSGKTLDQLKEDLAIKYNIYDDLVVLNYSQIDSPKTDPIVMECRSLILQVDSWDVVSIAFRRFFNYGEALEITKDFDFSQSVAQEKIDGSIISVFYHNDKWYMSTRGSIEGQGNVGFNQISFKQLFENTLGDQKEKFYQLLDKDKVYIFEQTSIENKVVRLYKERKLYLIGIRDKKNDFKEINPEDYILHHNLPYHIDCIECPQIYPFTDFEQLLQLHKDMEATEEGFVVVNYHKQDQYGNFDRVKVKNPAYVALAHVKESGGASVRCILQLVMLNEHKEFVNYFPEFQQIIDSIKQKYDQYVEKVNQDIEQVKSLIEDNVDRKTYAQTVCKMTCVPLMFEIYDGRANSFQQYVDNYNAKRGIKTFAKNMLKVLKIKDIDFQ